MMPTAIGKRRSSRSILVVAYILAAAFSVQPHADALLGGSCAATTSASFGNFSQHQLNNVATVIAVGRSMRAPPAVIVIGLMSAATESNFKNYANYRVPESLDMVHDAVGSNGRALGIFQQQPRWGTPATLMDPAKASAIFFRALFGKPWQSMPPWLAAQAVQRSAYANGSNYRVNFSKAKSLLAAIGEDIQVRPECMMASSTLLPSQLPISAGNDHGSNGFVWVKGTPSNPTHGYHLNLRATPDDSQPPIGQLDNGAKVKIVCTARGQWQTGLDHVATPGWDRLDDVDWGPFVADVFIYTGHLGPIPGIPTCPGYDRWSATA